MALHILSVHHRDHGLAEVARTVELAPHFAATLRALPGVEAVLPLATCNRVELVVDAPRLRVADLSAALAPDMAPDWDLFSGEEAVFHLFRVAAGLESMVVGEREIAGQVRRAILQLTDDGLSSSRLTTVVEEALRTSRRISRETKLAGAGRSVVSVALDLAGDVDWASTDVLLVGTGSFAGASVAALRARGAHRISVWSASNRGRDFAASHQLEVADDLADALGTHPVVVTCRGTGEPIITPELLEGTGPHTILDLALHRDVAPGVEQLDGVRVVDLVSIQGAVSDELADDAERAEQLIAEGIAETHTKLRTKVLDPAVVELREAVMELVNDEVSKLPQRELTTEDAAHALRRLATRLLHVPSMRAKEAAAAGRTQQYLCAMAELYGIGTPDQLEAHRCPATGLGVADLGPTIPVRPASHDERQAG